VRVDVGLLLKESIEDVEAVAQRAGDDDGVEPGELGVLVTVLSQAAIGGREGD